MILASILFSILFTFLLSLVLSGISRKTGGRWYKVLHSVCRTPFIFLLAMTGTYITLRLTPSIHQDASTWNILTHCFRTGIILVIAGFLYNLESDKHLMLSSINNRMNLQIHSILLPILSKTLRFLTLLIAVLVIAEEWDFRISGLLTGLGLGGLAFALAAQDTLSNLFGGIVILMDRPFVIGDWIITDMATGTVEKISFRSVRIRTFEQALVTVPNASLAKTPITNNSLMGKRGVNIRIALQFDTPQVTIRSCTKRIKAMLQENPDIDNETVVVVLDSIGDSSLNLAILYFTVTTVWTDFVEVKEAVFYSILTILDEEKANIALPTQTLHIEGMKK